MYYTQEQIDRANQADLVSFLQSQGEQLTRAGNEYRWKRHDSLTVRGNKWYRHSQSKGGAPIDFVMEFFGKSFTEAVELLTVFRREAHSGNRSVPGIRRITPGTGQIAACQTQENAGCSLGDSFPLNGMENFRLSVNLGQCEHDQAGLRLSYPCRPSTTP